MMGGTSSLYCKRWRKRNVRILFIGLDAAGKTTILYRLKLDEVVTTIPTIGFNVETIEHGDVSYTAWDVGLRSMTRPLLRHYYPGTEAVIFVVDSKDKERYEEGVEMLQETVSADELRDVLILVLANKQDLDEVMSREEILSDLMTRKFLMNKKFEVFAVSGIQGEGLREGLDWLTTVLTNTEPRSSNLTENKQQNDTKDNVKDIAKLSYYSQLITSFKRLFQ